MKHYNEIIIGAGPAGGRAAKLLAENGHKVLLAEGYQYGGTCPNQGCEPKIFLEGATRVALLSQQLKGQGIGQRAKINWEDLINAKLKRYEHYSENTENQLKHLLDTVHGYASFVNQHTVKIKNEEYEADNIIIATGQVPVKLELPGQEYLHTSEDLLSLKHLPNKMLFIGGGLVAIELATVVSAAGCQVSIVLNKERTLMSFPKYEVRLLEEEMKKRGIKFYFNTEISEIIKNGQGYTVSTNQGNLNADYIVSAVGRKPNLKRLSLENLKVKTQRQGIIVDEHLETNVAGVFALGDVIARPQPKLTPVAEFEAEYLVDYLLGKTKAAISYPTIGTAAFTFPQVAMAGVSPETAEGNPEYLIKKTNVSNRGLYAGENDQLSQLTLVYHDQQLVGVSAIGDHAADEVNNLLPVIGLKITKQQYWENVMPIFPTIADKIPYLL